MTSRSLFHVHPYSLAIPALSAFYAVRLAAEVVQIDTEQPTLDQWVYPFAQDPGGNPRAAIFAPFTDGKFHTAFDNRDGQMLIGYDTSATISPQFGPGAYQIISAAVTLTVEVDEWFSYDPTPDPYNIWLLEIDPEYFPDPDPGHAVELFGAGFRNGLSLETYDEDTPYSTQGSFGKGIRSAYPVAFADGECADVSNNVDARFDPVPFAVGLNPDLQPGQAVPLDSEFRFEITVSDPEIRRYLQRSLHRGRLFFTVASLFPAEQQPVGPGTYPRFYTKENLNVKAGLVSGPRLELVVDVSDTPMPVGDITGDGQVGVSDLLAVIGAWGQCPCCAADVNFDDVVNVTDLLIVIQTWG